MRGVLRRMASPKTLLLWAAFVAGCAPVYVLLIVSLDVAWWVPLPATVGTALVFALTWRLADWLHENNAK